MLLARAFLFLIPSDMLLTRRASRAWLVRRREGAGREVSAGRSGRDDEERPRVGCRVVGAERRPCGSYVGERGAAGNVREHPVVGRCSTPAGASCSRAMGARITGMPLGGGCGDTVEVVVRDSMATRAPGRLTLIPKVDV